MDKKQTAHQLLQKNRDEILAFGKALFSCPELGFQEIETSKKITSYLKEAGIPYEDGIALTGVKAAVGGGKGYHIALVADMDALAVTRDGRRVPFHSCGHSIQVTVMLAVLKVLRQSHVLDSTDVRVSFIGTPAEEFIDLPFRYGLIRKGKIRYPSGKQNMISQGVFDDVDCALSAHVTGDESCRFDVHSTLAGFTAKKAVFLGKAAHSGAAPHLGRNALHGALLTMNALSFLKDRYPAQAGVQIHPILTEGGTEMNIIPEKAVLETYVRANTKEDLFRAAADFDHCADHCAQALGLEVQIENRIGYMPLKQSDELCDLAASSMRTLCGEDQIEKNVVSGASGDIGDLGFLIPTLQFGFSGIRGRIHSDRFEIADEDHVYLDTARVVLDTILDLAEQKDLRVKNLSFREDKQYYLKNWLQEESLK